MLPDPVRSVAASASCALSPALEGMRTELVSGRVSPATIVHLTHYHTHPDSTIFAAMGGQPGAWWTAVNAASIPQELRPPRVDDWIIEMATQASDDVWVTAAAGETRPSLMREFDELAKRIDDRLKDQMLALLEFHLGKLLRAAGIQVMAAVKDPDLRAVLGGVHLYDVHATASGIEVRPGRTVLAVTGVQATQMIDRAVSGLRPELKALLDDAETEAANLYLALFGIPVADEAGTRVEDTIDAAVGQFVQIATSKLLPGETVDPTAETEAKPETRIRFGPGIATGLLAILTGGQGLNEQGMVDLGPVTSAPSIVKRPGLLSQAIRKLRELGTTLTAARADIAAEETALRNELAIANELLSELRHQARLAERALVGSVNREAAESRLRSVIEQRETQKTVVDRIRTQQRQTAKPAQILDQLRNDLGIPERASRIAENLANGRVEVTQRTFWVWASNGVPDNPFEPHRDLDGSEVGTDNWEQLRTSPLVSPTGRTAEPFSLGGWYPGDHAGCRCGYRTETILTTNPP